MSKKINKLEKEIAELKKIQIRNQFFIDEGLELMLGIKDGLQKLINNIRLHKFNTEDGKNPDDCNQKLWDCLEDETLNKW